MKKYLHLSLLLFFIAAFSGLILSVVNAATKDQIEAQNALKIANGIKALYSEHKSNEEILVLGGANFTEIRRVYSDEEQTELLGYVFIMLAPGSYSGELKIMVGINTQGNIVGVQYLNKPETPGVGSKVYSNLDSDFNKQFIGADIVNYTELDTISGATISSKSVKNGVISVLEYFEQYLKDSEVDINE